MATGGSPLLLVHCVHCDTQRRLPHGAAVQHVDKGQQLDTPNVHARTLRGTLRDVTCAKLTIRRTPRLRADLNTSRGARTLCR
eukprot:359226-Pyramimonas_sp.AAC.1